MHKVHFYGRPRKNDALFLYGATGPLPFVYTYCQNDTEVVHGPSCKPDLEIALERCCADGIAVRERRGGGGTVVLSSGVLVILVVVQRRKEDSIRESFSRIHRPLIALLQSWVQDIVEEKGISDLAINGKKILGSSMYLPRHPFFCFYQSSLMVGNDLSLIDRYLKHPPREPDYRRGRSHADFCTSLRTQGCTADIKQIAARVRDSLPPLLSAA